MPPENRLRYIRAVLYRLKRSYGSQLDIYNQSEEVVDYMYGTKKVEKKKWRVARAICLPRGLQRTSYFSDFVPAFQYGGVAEISDRDVIIDGKDISSDCKIETDNWYVVVGAKRYEIKRIEDIADGLAFRLYLKELKGAFVGQIIEVSLLDKIKMLDDHVEKVNHEINISMIDEITLGGPG